MNSSLQIFDENLFDILELYELLLSGNIISCMNRVLMLKYP